MNDPMTLRQRDHDNIDVLDLFILLARNAKLLVLGSLAAGLIALAISYSIPPTYTAATRILPPQHQQSAAALLAQQFGAIAGAAAASAGIKNPAETYVAMLKSSTVADQLVDQFDLVALYEVAYRQDARKQLAERTSAKAEKDGLITIEVDDHDPMRAADIANAYVIKLQDLTKTLAIGEAAQRRVLFENQLRQAKDNLTNAEIALRATGVAASMLKADPQSALGGIARIRAEIASAEVRLASMRGYLTNNSVEIRRAQQELSALRLQLAKLESNDDDVKQESGGDYISKFREYKYYETLFELLAKQYEMARLDEAREGAIVQVIDRAQPPEKKSKPRKAAIAVATTLIAFVLLAMIVFAREAVRSARRDPALAEKMGDVIRALKGR